MLKRILTMTAFTLLMTMTGCVSPRDIHGLKNDQVARLYEKNTGEIAKTYVNPVLYVLYPVYGLPMDIMSIPFDILTAIQTEAARGLMGASQTIFESKNQPIQHLGAGEGLVVGFCGSFVVSRVPFAALDNIFFRHGSGDYYSLGVRMDNPNHYFFPHLSNWPFTFYEQKNLIRWAATPEGREAIQAYKNGMN